MHQEIAAPIVTIQTLQEGLRAIGIVPGDIVIVHSSIKSFGRVEGGADTVIDSLCQAVGIGGAILMPTYNFGEIYKLTDDEKAAGFRWKIKRTSFDPSLTPCKTGKIPDTFWRRKDVTRGNDNSHSFAAWGNWGDNPEILRREVEPILARDPLVLLLGVDINSCSVMHIAEERVRLPHSIAQLMTVPDHVRALYPKAQWEIGFGPEPDWKMVYRQAVEQGIVREQKIGLSNCSLFKANKMVNLYAHFLRERPFELYHIYG
jgi:aminoglycoside N3'-acetyltransferase